MPNTPKKVFVGTAGWSYEDWRGIVYPADAPRGFDELAYLAQYFDAVEVNSSFYRPPAQTAVRSWLRRTAFKADFVFTFKLWQRFTHQRAERWTEGEADLYRTGVSPAAEAGRLGAVLLQFPWSFRFDETNLDWLGDVVRTFRDWPLVVEVRHAGWVGEAGLNALRDLKVSFCNIDQPVTRQSVAPAAHVTGPLGYVRLHGRNREAWFDAEAGRDDRYNYLYTDEELAGWVNRISELAQGTDRVYVFTNNHYRGQAPVNALQLIADLSGESVPVPEPLARAFPVLETIARRAPKTPKQRGLF